MPRKKTKPRNYSEAKAAGVCPGCYVVPPEEGHTRCQHCLDAKCKYEKLARVEKANNTQCKKCFSPVINRFYCQNCKNTGLSRRAKIVDGMKQCTNCKEWKLTSEFTPKKVSGTFNSQCRCCSAKSTARYHAQNRDLINIRAREKYASDPEKHLAEYRLWKSNNPVMARLVQYKASAKSRNINYTLPRQLFEDLITDNCVYCGCAPNPYNGIDRVDNNKGYVIDNVVSCCGRCNKFKQDTSIQEFFTKVQLIASRIPMLTKLGNYGHI